MASALRESVALEMRLRGFSPRTHESYVHALEELAKFYRRALETLVCAEVQAFLDHLITQRFCSHILPRGFVKIRYYGWLSAAKRKTALPAIREALNAPPPETETNETLAERILESTGIDITRCPNCGKGHLRNTGIVIPPQRGPP